MNIVPALFVFCSHQTLKPKMDNNWFAAG